MRPFSYEELLARYTETLEHIEELQMENRELSDDLDDAYRFSDELLYILASSDIDIFD